MVRDQIRARGVRDERVLAAMARVPRHVFIAPEHRHEAYEDHPVPIGFGQTISQPYIVGFMTEALRPEPGHRVLEVGTGCGYQTAVLADIVAEVFSIERIDALAEAAQRTLSDLGYTNVHVRAGDGALGWPDAAPFDRIIVAAAAREVPSALRDQLAEGGILVIPLGVSDQDLHVFRKRNGALETRATLPVRFVPLVVDPLSPEP